MNVSLPSDISHIYSSIVFHTLASLLSESSLPIAVNLGGLAVNELQIFTPKPKDCKIYSEKIPDAYGFGHYHLYKDIALDFNKIKKFPVSYNDCLNTIKLLNAFYVSSEKNKSVVVKNINDSKKLGKKNEKISKKYR